VQRVTGNPEFAFSLGEITANPFVVGLERNTAGTITREAQNARLQTMVRCVPTLCRSPVTLTT
jgi:hypothetical protein